MILEAFSQYLQTASPELSASQVLSAWLWERLNCVPKTNVDQVIHCEVVIAKGVSSRAMTHPRTIRLPEDAELALKTRGRVKRLIDSDLPDLSVYFFKGSSPSGIRLLNSLYEYSMSYEQQKWSRFIHTVKASDFRLPRP
ncbi:MAG: hypothetical protein JSS83_03220 [Cyanobacteria bacterium SZAS LIN-3]|nr:hypothetical protein [Cyanobacteria bacterium SZAS LIN-3]